MITEPRNVSLLRTGGGEMGKILDAQLREADLIVLNKCDTIDAARVEEDRAFLSARYPEAELIANQVLVNKRSRETAEKARLGMKKKLSGTIDIANRVSLSEYYLQYHALVCCFDFDGSAYLTELAGRVRAAFDARGYAIPHLKLLAWGPDGDFGKADLLGTDRPVELTRPFERPCTELAVILNASAACPPEELDAIVTSAAEESSAAFQLEMTVYKKDCFGMGD